MRSTCITTSIQQGWKHYSLQLSDPLESDQFRNLFFSKFSNVRELGDLTKLMTTLKSGEAQLSIKQVAGMIRGRTMGGIKSAEPVI
jgi:hypothetical protein